MTSTMRFDKWQNSLGNGNVSIESGNFYSPGSVIQVLQSTKTTSQSGSVSSSWVDISGLSVSITPKFNTSKFLILATINGSTTYDGLVRVVRDSTAVGVGTTSSTANGGSFIGMRGNTYEGFTSQITYLDSPSTGSTIVYKAQIWGNPTYYVNRTPNEDTSGEITMSSITVMEIAQ